MLKVEYTLSGSEIGVIAAEESGFVEGSSMFKTAPERIFARETATKYGSRLEKKWPLGYENCQMAVVFEYGCPNNSLPIFWKESPKQKWIPLFKRS